MSYDLYCYRAASDARNSAEAQALVEAINAAEEAGDMKATASGTKERITAALVAHDPRLEPFEFDYSKIAEFHKISDDEARSRYQHVELNPPEGDDARVFSHLGGFAGVRLAPLAIFTLAVQIVLGVAEAHQSLLIGIGGVLFGAIDAHPIE